MMQWAIALAVVVSSVTVAQDAKSSYLPGIDFSKYRTYHWITKRPHPNPDVDAEIKRSIDSQLTSKGLSKTDNKPDLTVDYRVAMSQREQWSSFGQMELQTQAPNTQASTVYFGTLGIDMTDPALNRVVWTGFVSKAVDPNNSASSKQRNLNKAVEKLLRDFPPGQRP